MDKKTLVVNLFAGLGAGKSSLCAHIFAALKWRDINCEMSREWAKDKVLEGSSHVLKNQMYIFGKQQHRLFSLKNEVDIVITDSPLLLSIIYDIKKRNKGFTSVVL